MVLPEEIEVEKTCRVCMRQIGQKMQPLEIYESLITDLTQVELLQTDSLPRQVCNTCAGMLITANMVRINVIEVQRQWLELLNAKTEMKLGLDTEVEEPVTDIEDGSEIRGGQRIVNKLVNKNEVQIKLRDPDSKDSEEEGGIKESCRLCLKEFDYLPDSNHIDNFKPLMSGILDLKPFRFNVQIPSHVCGRCKEQLLVAAETKRLCSKADGKMSQDKCLLCHIKCYSVKVENPNKLKDLAFQLSDKRLDLRAFRRRNFCYACLNKLNQTAKLQMRSKRIEDALELQFKNSLIKDLPELQFESSLIKDKVTPTKCLTVEKAEEQSRQLYNDDDEAMGEMGGHKIDDEENFVFGMPEWNKNREIYDDTDEEIFPVPLNKPFEPVWLHCEFCDFKSSSDYQLKLHMDLRHLTKGTTCDTCGMILKTEALLKKHKHRIHYGITSELCYICGKSYVQASLYDIHMLTVHADTANARPIRNYPCKYCSATFKKGINLKSHLRSHTGEKPFACQYCPKAYSMSTDLKRHMCTHTGDWPYVCASCSKGFAKKSGIESHVKTHGEEWTYYKKDLNTNDMGLVTIENYPSVDVEKK